MRAACERSYGCKFRRKLATASKVKRNCIKVTKFGKEVWSVNHKPMYKNQIEGGTEQGEQAQDCKALVVKAHAA